MENTMDKVWERGMNAAQLEVIRHGQGPLQTLAQAGSGKTRAVVNRVARLILEDDVSPDQILCVTFSKKAAEEMVTRIRLLGVSAAVHTWHSLALRILKEDCTTWSTWTVDEKDKAKGLLKDACGYKHVNWRGVDVTKLRRLACQIKAAHVEFDAPEAAAMAKAAFGGQHHLAIQSLVIWQELVEDAHLLTFDDMLTFATRYLERDELAASQWSGRWAYMIQDEAQDANVVQKTMAKILAGEHRNYMIVGDPAQAIYGFRGSSPEHLMAFEAEWPGAARVAMCDNYRSGEAIVRCANAVIQSAAVRLPEDMRGNRGVEGKVSFFRADTLDDEGEEFVAWCKAKIESGAKPSDIACLYRTNAQSRALEEALLKAKLPYVILGGINFYERKEVKDLLGYLRVASNRDEGADAVRRCINAPFRFLGAKFVERVMERAGTAGWVDCVMMAAQGSGIQQRQIASATDWARLVAAIAVSIQEGGRPAEILGDLVKRTGYIEWLEKEEGEESIETSHGANVREMIRVADRFATVDELLDYVEVQTKEGDRLRRQRGVERIMLLTVHKSKGLEWPNVWVTGCNEDVFPHRRGDQEEERRLFYVAVTRARDELVMSAVTHMATKWGMRELAPSRFVSDAGMLAVQESIAS